MTAHTSFNTSLKHNYFMNSYKVARVEQTETPAMMEERVKHMKRATKFDRVVNREVCRVSSIGTRMASVIDADMLSDHNSYLMAITEIVSQVWLSFCVEFVVSFR